MPSVSKSTRKRAVGKPEDRKPDKLKRIVVEDEVDADLSSDIKGIFGALQQIKENAQKVGQKKNEETISSVLSGIKSNLDELKTKLEKDRQNFARALSKSSKECENLWKNESTKLQSLYENICKEQATHLQALKDAFSKYEDEKERLFILYEQMRKKEKSALAELEKASANKIADLEESLKKNKKEDQTFSLLKNSLGSFLDSASDEDFPTDD